eukprot:3387781-Rhodomonas_salina.1
MTLQVRTHSPTRLRRRGGGKEARRKEGGGLWLPPLGHSSLSLSAPSALRRRARGSVGEKGPGGRTRSG